jgi:hypothetical protein
MTVNPNLIWVAIVLTAAVQVIKFLAAVRGRPLGPTAQFFVSLFTAVLGALGFQGGEFAETLVALFASMQAVYNTAKRLVAILRTFRRV